MRPEISVIIPALNEEKYIGRALNGLAHQSFKDFETIVVDGGSTDKTRSIARKCAVVIIERKRGVGRARNVGASCARGSILVFMDADTRPSSSLLGAYHHVFKNNRIVAATGPIKPLERTSRRLSIGFSFVSVFLIRFSMLIGRPSMVGSNFAVKKEAFDKVGGFDSNLITYEDLVLSNELKKTGKIAYVPSALVYTSARRVLAWGIRRYFVYHLGNMIHYHLFKKPKRDYAPIR